MARLKVATALIEEALFSGALARIVGAHFEDDVVVFDIEGPDVPAVRDVRAIITERQRTVEFQETTTP